MKKSLWGGRFKKSMSPLLKEFSYSFMVDGELLLSEIRVNQAYAQMLAKVGLITSSESKRLIQGLQAIAKDWNPDQLSEHAKTFEDVHTFVQQELERRVGAVGKKIHTGRSRNDLVVTSTIVYLRNKLAELSCLIQLLQASLVHLAIKADQLIVPGMTHLRKAQPVLLAHHLLAYVEMLALDQSRFADALKRMNVLPLGSAAIAGSALPLDRSFLAKALGFDRVSENSMQSTADRSFATEILSDYAILWMHLSRLSEDFILWNSECLGYLELDDAFATGSSLMPQKKNPDVFELIRGRAGVVFGHLQSMLTVQKGLPLAYNRDLQEDKPGLFDTIRKTEIGLQILSATIETASFKSEAISHAIKDDGLFATDVLEYMIRKQVPFASAHEIAGQIVRACQDQGRGIQEFSLEEWKQFSPVFEKDVYDLFDPSVSVAAKKTYGSTQPKLVAKQLQRWKKQLKTH